ncbi:unnamed protein product [Coccothraustes coccothraustes]
MLLSLAMDTEEEVLPKSSWVIMHQEGDMNSTDLQPRTLLRGGVRLLPSGASAKRHRDPGRVKPRPSPPGGSGAERKFGSVQLKLSTTAKRETAGSSQAKQSRRSRGKCEQAIRSSYSVI